jgi:CheY-like chemotaxis protein
MSEEVKTEQQKLGNTIPLHILIAEDNLINQKLIAKIFNSMGYEVDVADNGVIALQHLEKKSYELVTLDIQMPEMDGITCAKEIHKKYGDSRPVLVSITANIQLLNPEGHEKDGMDDVITKPFKAEDLKNMILKWFGNKQN